MKPFPLWSLVKYLLTWQSIQGKTDYTVPSWRFIADRACHVALTCGHQHFCGYDLWSTRGRFFSDGIAVTVKEEFDACQKPPRWFGEDENE